jgi:hypothetical protein
MALNLVGKAVVWKAKKLVE